VLVLYKLFSYPWTNNELFQRQSQASPFLDINQPCEYNLCHQKYKTGQLTHWCYVTLNLLNLCGASVDELLRSFTSNHLPLTTVSLILNPIRDFGFFHVKKLSNKLTESWWFYSVALRAWNNAQEGTWGLPPSPKLEHRQWPIQFRCDIKLN
jgi:hypothetical protein